MYTAEQLMPKRYPENKPSEMDWIYWVMGNNFEGRAYWGTINYDWKNVKWFIPIPNAPEELKPLAYPENKPSERGVYICHDKHTDRWFEHVWRGSLPQGNEYFSWRELVDWFIPYRLDEQLEREDDVSNVILNIKRPGRTLAVSEYCGGMKTLRLCEYTPNTGKNCSMQVDDAELTAFARHWLDLQGYDVVKREPEINECPNPECNHELQVLGFMEWHLECAYCGYHSPHDPDKFEAIRLHNLIAGKE